MILIKDLVDNEKENDEETNLKVYEIIIKF